MNIQVPLPPADFYNYLLTTKPGIATKILPVVTQVARSPIPPNLKIPLLIIGATVAAGAIIYSLTQKDQKEIQDKALEKHNAENTVPTTGSKCFKIDFLNLVNTRGTGYECHNTLEIIPSTAYPGKLALRSNGVDQSSSTSCHEITIQEIPYDANQAPPSSEYGTCATCWAVPGKQWNDLTTQEKEAALDKLSYPDIEPIIKKAQPSRLPEGFIFNNPVVFTGDDYSKDPLKQQPFVVNNPDPVDSDTVEITVGGEFPSLQVNPTIVNPPTKDLDPPIPTITIPTSPKSNIIFGELPNGGIVWEKIGTPTLPLIEQPKTTKKNEDISNEDLHNQLREVLAKMSALPGAIAIGLAPALTRIPSTEQFKSNVAAGVCRTMEPGGCGDNAIKRNTNNVNQTLGNKIDALNSAGQDAALAAIFTNTNTINGKMGNLLPNGGLAGQMLRNVTFAGVDRVVNIMTLAASVHNAMMLSNNIGQTLFSAIDNILAIPQLIVNPNAETVNSQEAVTKYLDNYFKALFGATEWQAIKAQWKAYSTIYSSTAQAFDNTRSILNDTQELMNQGRNFTAELGNGLVDEGILGEDNWDYKNSKQKVKSRVLGKLERVGRGLEVASEGLEALENVTSTLRNITETANSIKENINEIDKALDDANKAARTDRDAKEKGLELPNFSLEDLF